MNNFLNSNNTRLQNPLAYSVLIRCCCRLCSSFKQAIYTCRCIFHSGIGGCPKSDHNSGVRSCQPYTMRGSLWGQQIPTQAAYRRPNCIEAPHASIPSARGKKHCITPSASSGLMDMILEMPSRQCK